MRCEQHGRVGGRGGRVGVTVALVTAALGLVACAQSPALSGPGPAAPTAAAPTLSAPTALNPNAAPDPSAPAAAQRTSWRMPNLVGRGLQNAQDAIQALTGDPLFVTRSHDATGAGRRQILDRDWKVCDQNIPPGATFTADTRIDFGAVKLSEHC